MYNIKINKTGYYDCQNKKKFNFFYPANPNIHPEFESRFIKIKNLIHIVDLKHAYIVHIMPMLYGDRSSVG